MTHDSIEKQPQAGLSRRTALRLAAVGAGILATASSVGLDVLPASAAVLWNHPFAGARRASNDGFGARGGTHRAIDWAAPGGTAIYAVAAGVVDEIRAPFEGPLGWAGWAVRIRHAEGYWSFYAHMIAKPLVTMNQKVLGNTQIGKVGSTGYSTGNHLHLELFHGGTYRQNTGAADDRIDPAFLNNAPLAGSNGAPISGEEMPTALATTRSTDVALQTLTPAAADGAEWPLLPYINASNSATNFAEVVSSATIFSGVATFYIRNLPAGEVVSIRASRWKKSDDSKSALATTMIAGTGQEVVKGQYVFNTEINQSSHRLVMQAYASVPGVVVDYWGIAGQTW